MTLPIDEKLLANVIADYGFESKTEAVERRSGRPRFLRIMDLPTLVDSNICMALFRQRRDPIREVMTRISQTDLVTCGVVRGEVLRGLKLPRDKERLAGFLDVMQNVPTDNHLWVDAAEMTWMLDRKGIVLPAPDVLIACCAIRAGAAVLTFDGHFKRIPGGRVRDWE